MNKYVVRYGARTGNSQSAVVEADRFDVHRDGEVTFTAVKSNPHFNPDHDSKPKFFLPVAFFKDVESVVLAEEPT